MNLFFYFAVVFIILYLISAFLSVWQFTFTCWRNSDIKFGIHSLSSTPPPTLGMLHVKSGSVGWQHCFSKQTKRKIQRNLQPENL